VSQITAAMIMGAGLGSRMRPLTDDRPKPLVRVAGKTLIDHSIDRLVAAGVTTVVVNLHYKAEMLRAHLRQRHNVKIIFSDETEKLLDTGGGVVKALHLFGDKPFLVLNSDSIWVEGPVAALPAMMAHWDEARMDGLLLLADMQTVLGYEGRGDFVLKAQGHVLRARDHAGAAYAYPGVQIAHPRMFAGAPDGPFSTNLMWDRAITKDRLFGTVLDGVWIHVGTPQARDEAEAYLRQPA
jgi:N-acetyl-alpha-D-muramate 1-phosphate uridylyltransferase